MNVKTLFSLLMAALLVSGCIGESGRTNRGVKDIFVREPGDSTVYALTAVGSNDSILVFLTLPYNGADPDTVNILEALRQRKVFGRPQVGDNVAIVRNDSDSTLAERVIVTEQFAGTWCYNVYPRLRRKLGEGPLPPRLQKMLEEPREYGMVVKPAGVMITMGTRVSQADEQSPVVYQRAKNYGRWAIFNGHLVLSEVKRDSAGNRITIGTDTADFVRMRRDTLILRFRDGDRKYYRKDEEEHNG